MPREYGAAVKHCPADEVGKLRDQGAPTFPVLMAEARERSGVAVQQRSTRRRTG